MLKECKKSLEDIMLFKIVKTTAEALKPDDCYEQYRDFVEAFAGQLNSGEGSKLRIWPKYGDFDGYFYWDKPVYKVIWVKALPEER